MRPIQRRELLRGGAGGLSLAALGGAGLSRAKARASSTSPAGLVPDPQGVLDLPPGFSYRVLQRQGERMSDGYRVPGHADAMAVFPGADGSLVLMRNHEIGIGDRASSPYAPEQPAPPEAYDPEGYGGVTRLVLDPASLAVRRSNLVLAGTHWNCAGGTSPWGFLSCEEIFAPKHGYVFLCPTDSDRVAPAHRIPSYGRFRHEAASVDPRDHVAYLTEDAFDAAFYRFVPNDPKKPFEGKLQALCITGAPRFDTSLMRRGSSLPVSWVDVERPDPDEDDVRRQAHEKGAARFARTEGMWLSGDDVFLSATVGGPIGRGQIFRLRLRPEPRLELVAQAEDTRVLDMPDNLTVSPQGQVYVAEDGYEGNYLRRITLDGRIVDFARNALSESELAGPCFSPDGNTMFVNIQHDGLTLAIRGPFQEEPRRDRAVRETRADAGCEGKGVMGLGGGLAVLALAALARRRRQKQSE